MAEEWVNQALSNSWEAKNKLVNSDKALAEAEKKYKDPLFHLVEAELGCKNIEVALGGGWKASRGDASFTEKNQDTASFGQRANQALAQGARRQGS